MIKRKLISILSAMSLVLSSLTVVPAFAEGTAPKCTVHTETSMSFQSRDEDKCVWVCLDCPELEREPQEFLHTTEACEYCGWDPSKDNGEHSLGEWKNNDTSHWKECENPNCSETEGTKFLEATHDGAICSICGYDSTDGGEHNFSIYQYNSSGHWKVCTNPNCSETAGTKFQTGSHNGTACDVCGWAPHIHTDASSWSTDATNHWKVCTSGTCDDPTYKGSLGAHTYNGKTNVASCSICGKTNPNYQEEHTHTFESSWSTNDNKHWKASTCGHSVTKDEGKHDFGDNEKKCKTCGLSNPNYDKDASSKTSNSSAPTRAQIEQDMTPKTMAAATSKIDKEAAALMPATTFNMAEYRTTAGFAAGIMKAANLNGKNKQLTVYTTAPVSIDKSVLVTAQSAGVDFVYYFNYKNHLYRITIPAKADVTKVLESRGFSGPLFVGAVLGTSALVK